MAATAAAAAAAADDYFQLFPGARADHHRIVVAQNKNDTIVPSSVVVHTSVTERVTSNVYNAIRPSAPREETRVSVPVSKKEKRIDLRGGGTRSKKKTGVRETSN